ncbi:hypothetical protein [Marinobacterium lacunae]|uniref:hypothetical protein n=1 Tax=Marinobacterium lacunae TaxID=1232683 RepID=UPI0005626DFF|nr:hypothetical protein [Marinobacterium lacunae]
MSEQISKGNIRKYIEAWSGFDKEISEENNAFSVKLSSADKVVIITMPYEVGEFFLDFYMGDSPIFSDWYEIMEDPLDDFMLYTEQVVRNFLFHEVRIRKLGWWIFKSDEIQYSENCEWHNVFTPKT